MASMSRAAASSPHRSPCTAGPVPTHLMLNTMDRSFLPEATPSATTALLMQARQTVLPKRLLAPGPTDEQLDEIFQAAATAPDHGQLRPWRFVLVPEGERGRLAEVFADALLQRDATASVQELGRAREKAYRAPLLMLAIVDSACGDSAIDFNERLVSAGCAIQNILLMATAQGWGSALTSGKAMKSAGLRNLFGLSDGEQALCFISIGSASAARPARHRPQPAQFTSTLEPLEHPRC